MKADLLGLPIPHKAIVPRNKNRIGEGLGAFLERHFLTDELLLTKLRALDPAQHIATWLAAREHAETIADRLVRVLPHVVNTLDDDEIRAFTARALGKQLQEIDIAPLLGKGIGFLTEGGYHAAVLDRGVELALDFLRGNADRLEAAAAQGERRRWWMPKAVDRQIARALLDGLEEVLEDARKPGSNTRARLLRAIDELAGELVASPEQRRKVEEAKRRILDESDELRAWLGSVWDRLRDVAVADLASPSSKTREAVATVIASLGRGLLADAGMRVRLNGFLESGALGLLPWRSELARFIADVVRRWDERVLVERMELTLGADLQYVRITGTLVGGSIGCVLFLVSSALR